MIHRLFSSDPRFKTLRFRPGLNILLADKTEASAPTDTRNGAGKTSVIDLVHFLLGGDWDRTRESELVEDVFGLEFDLAGTRVTVRRTGATPGRVTFDANLDSKKWPIQPERHRDGLSLRNDDWSAVLGHFAFRLPVEHHDDTFRPKFRNLFSYFARRVKQGGFLDPHSIQRHQQLWDQQVCVTYLLGLDWTIPRDMELIRKKERTGRELRKLLADSNSLFEYVPGSGELRSRLLLGENRAEALRRSLSEFQVVDEYHELEVEVDQLTKALNALADQNTVDRQVLSELEHALSAEAPSGAGELAEIYRQAGALLPDRVLRRFDEVRAFHESVIRNRRSYLDVEMRSARARLSQSETQQRAIDVRRSQILKILQTSGALENFIQIEEEFARVQAAVERVREQHEYALKFENLGREIAMEKTQLETRMAVNQVEQADQIRRAVVVFAETSGKLYTQPGQLTVATKLTGPPIQVEIPRQDSEGVSMMQIFCFDMTMLQMMVERKIGPSFLIHDSQIFDGVDARQVSRALQAAAEMSAATRRQYITMLNTDVAEEVTKEGFPVESAAMSTRLSDQDRGGLFGRSFGAEGPQSKRRSTRRS